MGHTVFMLIHKVVKLIYVFWIGKEAKLMHGKTSLIKHGGQGIFKGIKKLIVFV